MLNINTITLLLLFIIITTLSLLLSITIITNCSSMRTEWHKSGTFFVRTSLNSVLFSKKLSNTLQKHYPMFIKNF